MDPTATIEAGLENALQAATARAPRRLAAAMRHAVFPGGARIRPRLCLAVAHANAAPHQTLAHPTLAATAATAIELMHCASLVHDDLPCFDDAPLRRGIPSVHTAYGEALAVLAGDGLIILAFETIAHAATADPAGIRLLTTLAAAAGAPSGLVAGQAMECEPQPKAEPALLLASYQRAKTASLFSAAAMSGAIAAGADPHPWRKLGECLGEAYQIADDIRDVACSESELGKRPGRDAALGRPSAVSATGIEPSLARLHRLVEDAVAAIPPCDNAAFLTGLIRAELDRLVPPHLLASAA